MNIIEEFIKGLKSGKILIHPTDTIPGLTYDPLSEQGFQLLCELKKRDMSKTCIGLVNSLDMASRFFQDIDPRAMDLLKKYWPSPLSVVALASEHAPPSMIRSDGTISLRFPSLRDEHRWLYEVMDSIDFPLPTTSINESGEPAVTTWQGARLFSDSHPDVINLVEPYQVSSSSPSTIVKIVDGKFKILRQGKLIIEKGDIEEDL